MKAPKDNRLVLRVARDLRESLAREAEKDRRPLAALCRLILEDHIEGRRFRTNKLERRAGA
jgi:hypothetical protein